MMSKDWYCQPMSIESMEICILRSLHTGRILKSKMTLTNTGIKKAKAGDKPFKQSDSKGMYPPKK